MNKNDPVWGAARVLHRILSRSADSVGSELRRQMRSLLEHQQAIRSCWHRCELARSHGWHMAAALEQPRLVHLLTGEQALIDEIVERSSQRRADAPSPPPGLRELLAELAHLSEEFDHVVIEPRSRVIAVRTPAITLQDIDLGRFRIELHLARLADHLDSSAIDIIALDPNPAGSSEMVTHPHVSDRSLCAGDAAVPLYKALRDGRICDAFLLVQGVLSTYNAASAFVSLEEWSGACCGECGHPCHCDDLYYCSSCQRDFCESCIGVCAQCDGSYCAGCLEGEHGARRDLCPHCRALRPPSGGHIEIASEIEPVPPVPPVPAVPG